MSRRWDRKRRVKQNQEVTTAVQNTDYTSSQNDAIDEYKPELIAIEKSRQACESSNYSAAKDANDPLHAKRSSGYKKVHAQRAAGIFSLHVHNHEFHSGQEIILSPEYFSMLKDMSPNDYVIEVFHPSEYMIKSMLEGESSSDSNVNPNISSSTSTPSKLNASNGNTTPVSTATYKSNVESGRRGRNFSLPSAKGYARNDREKDAQDHLLLEIPIDSHKITLKGKVQVSILKEIATFFCLQPFKDVVINFVPKWQVEAKFVEVSLKDQFISRRDLWYLKRSMIGKPVTLGKNVRLHGTRWQVLDIHAAKHDKRVVSGVVSEQSRFVFRSKTSRVMWLIQVSPELWDIANNGYLYLEILLNVVEHVLQKWIRHKVSHSLTILLFARSYYPSEDVSVSGEGSKPVFPKRDAPLTRDGQGSTHVDQSRNQNAHIQSKLDECSNNTTVTPSGAIIIDEEGRRHQDFYKVVVFDSIVADVQPLLIQLKSELNDFPRACGWKPTSHWLRKEIKRVQSSQHMPSGIPSTAQDGNLLEAINIVLNIFEKHHIDRHLSRTGQNVMIATAGSGIFKVNKQLSEITEQRMMDHGIGIDIICLSTPPLHRCPLFLFKGPQDKASPTRLTQDDSNIVGKSHLAPGCCSCGANPAKSKQVMRGRRSRTGSMDALHNPDPIQKACSMSRDHSTKLCKRCSRSAAKKSSHVIPLWIPVTFVEEVLGRHSCPLDTNIMAVCEICSPAEESNVFKPLPICRMLKKKVNIGNTSIPELPRPLEYLLDYQNNHPSSESVNIDPIADADVSLSAFANANKIASITRREGVDLVVPARRSTEDLIRARIPSITLPDENGSISLDACGLNANNSLSPGEGLLFHQFECYDETVFQARGDTELSLMQRSRTPDYEYAISPSLRSGSESQQYNNGSFTLPNLALGGKGNANIFSNYLRRHRLKRNTCDSVDHSIAASAGSSKNEFLGMEDNSYQSTARDTVNDSILHRGVSPTIFSEYYVGTSTSPNIINRLALRNLADESHRTSNNFGSLPNSTVVDPAIIAMSSNDGTNGIVATSRPDNFGGDGLFRTHADLYKQLTSNRRRWSQLYSKTDPFKLVRTTFQWKTLVFPALLPLTTDYFPNPKELKEYYTESFYSITLPERDEQNGETYQDYRELVMEMIAQRFSQDFQLVAREGPVSFPFMAESGLGSGAGSEKPNAAFRLSMGHRIHEIAYNEEAQTIDVKRYQQRAAALSDVDIMEYRYSLWSPFCDGFLTTVQEFRKYSRNEYAWNYLDQLICGYYDEMSDVIKYKHITYCIIPPHLDQAESSSQRLQDYAERFMKFHEYLRSRAGNSARFPNIDVRTEWREGSSTSGEGAFKRVLQRAITIPLHASDAMTRQNWIILKLDTILRSAQCYHVELQWIVCCSSMVEDFILGITRRAKQLGLEILQVPASGISPNLNIHPLICPIFIPLQGRLRQALLEQALVEQYSFCAQGMHLMPTNLCGRAEEYRVIYPEHIGWSRKHRGCFYRQYIHRTLPCYVRVTQTGLVWISNCQQNLQEAQILYENVIQTVKAVQVAEAELQNILESILRDIVN